MKRLTRRKLFLSSLALTISLAFPWGASGQQPGAMVPLQPTSGPPVYPSTQPTAYPAQYEQGVYVPPPPPAAPTTGTQAAGANRNEVMPVDFRQALAARRAQRAAQNPAAQPISNPAEGNVERTGPMGTANAEAEWRSVNPEFFAEAPNNETGQAPNQGQLPAPDANAGTNTSVEPAAPTAATPRGPEAVNNQPPNGPEGVAAPNSAAKPVTPNGSAPNGANGAGSGAGNGQTNYVDAYEAIDPDGLGYFGNPIGYTVFAMTRARMVAGVEGVFLAPTSSDVQTVTMGDLVNDVSYSQNANFAFGNGIRTWLGLQSDHLGIRATYFGFEDSRYSPNPNSIVGQNYSFSQGHQLNAGTVDLEFFQQFCFGRSRMEASLGARYAWMDRSSMVMGSGELSKVSLLGISEGMSNMDGWGVTAGLSGEIPVFNWRCPEGAPNPWAFIWRLQGGALQGETTVKAKTLAQANTQVTPLANAYSADSSMAYWDGIVGMGTLQLGMNYRRPLRCCACPAFLDVRFGFEGQIWQMGSVFAQSESHAFLAGNVNQTLLGGAVQSRSLVDSGSVGLAGFFFGLGLNY